jgi:3'-phosphoadenosine 5'-phosphosulfate sulfotransferase (PAPS reductase)/FAD synthetase
MDDVDFYLEDLKSKFSKINPEEYYLSYSGGRDSHFLFWFIKEYLGEDRIEIVSVNTRMMYPEILRRVNKNADTVLVPKKKPQQIKEEVGLPCFTKQQDGVIEQYQKGNRSESVMNRVEQREGRYSLNNLARKSVVEGMHKVSAKCCDELKKKPMKQYAKTTKKKAIIGVRADEGILRQQYKSCFTKKGTFTPIFDLTDDLLEMIENKYDFEIPEVYNYVSRTGCVGCPYGRKNEVEFALNYVSPARRKFLVDYFKESYDLKGIKYKKEDGDEPNE